jgi:hypothetical protein
MVLFIYSLVRFLGRVCNFGAVLAARPLATAQPAFGIVQDGRDDIRMTIVQDGSDDIRMTIVQD